MKLLVGLLALATLLASAPAQAQTAAAPTMSLPEWRVSARERVLGTINRSRVQMRAALKSAGPIGPADRFVLVGLVVARNGKVLSTSIARSSGNAALDEGVRHIVARSGRLPPLPAGFGEQHKVTVPVRIKQPDVIATQSRRKQ